ncbi:16861_t:CDS:1, partial [Funneliformis caledonium]
MRVCLELNKREFIICIVSINNNIRPGYVCESDITAKIYLIASEAINEAYKKIFNIGTWYSGPSVIGFDNEYITKQLISDVVFYPFKISIDKLSVLIIKLGILDDDSDNIIGYQS